MGDIDIGTGLALVLFILSVGGGIWRTEATLRRIVAGLKSLMDAEAESHAEIGKQIQAQTDRLTDRMDDINENLVWLKAKANGKD